MTNQLDGAAGSQSLQRRQRLHRRLWILLGERQQLVRVGQICRTIRKCWGAPEFRPSTPGVAMARAVRPPPGESWLGATHPIAAGRP
jgi:hypothetical protein